jgi:hypothetical protein
MMDRNLISSVIDRWRSATMTHRASLDDDAPSPFEQVGATPSGIPAPPHVQSPSVQPAQAWDPNRLKLRKPIEPAAAPAATVVPPVPPVSRGQVTSPAGPPRQAMPPQNPQQHPGALPPGYPTRR